MLYERISRGEAYRELQHINKHGHLPGKIYYELPGSWETGEDFQKRSSEHEATLTRRVDELVEIVYGK